MLIYVYFPPWYCHSLIPAVWWDGTWSLTLEEPQTFWICLKKQETQINPYLAMTSGPYRAERSVE